MLSLKPLKWNPIALYKEGHEVQENNAMGTQSGGLFWNPNDCHRLIINLGWPNFCFETTF
jgi:hypothetical protein